MPSIHNFLIFKECVNYIGNGSRVTEHGATTVIREIADNNYNTFSDATDFDIDISDGTNPTRVDAVFVKSKNVTSYDGTPSGGSGTGWTSRSMPTAVDNFNGVSVSTTVDGFQHDLYLLSTHFTATSVRLEFSGTNAEIYEVMLLEVGLEIDGNDVDLGGFYRFDRRLVDRTGAIDTSPQGQLTRTPPVDNARQRRNIDAEIRIKPDVSTLGNVDTFLYFMEANPQVVVSEEFSRYPDAVYPAIFASLRIPVRYRTSYKPNGYAVPFSVREQ